MYFRTTSQTDVLPLIMLLVLACAISACQPDQVEQNKKRQANAELAPSPTTVKEFIFGFDLRTSPKKDARQYQSLLRYLSEKTGYSFTMTFTPLDIPLAEAIERGNIDLAAIGAVSYLKASQKLPGVIPLVKGINSNGEARYRSFIVVKPDSPLESITDLVGARLAFGNRDSTQGHLIPRILMANAGIKLEQLASYGYTGSHQNCATAVIKNNYDACGMQDSLALELAEQNLVRILTRSAYFPSSGIIASPSVPAEARTKIQQALIDLEPNEKDKSRLYQWETTEMPNGFTRAQPGDYDELKRWLLQLDLL